MDFIYPLGGIICRCGHVAVTGSKGSRIWLFGIGIFLITLVVQLLPINNHYPPIFSIGGGLILASFSGILWYWAKRHTILEGDAQAGADLQLVDYVFFLIAMWYLCGELGGQFWEAIPKPTKRFVLNCWKSAGWMLLFRCLQEYSNPMQECPQGYLFSPKENQPKKSGSMT